MRNLLITLFVCLLFFGCKPNTREQNGQSEIRIISLSPGITNTVIDAGFEGSLVGRSSFCFHADENIPVVGNLLEIDYERLLKLSPTHVFVQQTVSDTDSHLFKLAEQGNFELHDWPINRVSDIQTLYGDVTEMFGGSRKEITISNNTGHELQSPVLIITQGIEGSAGLCFGKDTYLDDLLNEMEIDNVLERTGWISHSFEDLGRLDPQIIIVVSDSEIKESVLVDLRSLGFPVIPFVHEHVLIPSSYIVDVAEQLQKITHSP
jgi:ABC-type hemin transport system substrate-binding protein